MNKELFYKRFSVGLTLDATLFDFEKFLAKYHKYIANFYFSLPLGDKFHARENVVKQMRAPEKVKLLWQMLHTIQSYDIKLELVLNNGSVTEGDVYAAKQLLDEHGIIIDLLGITGELYENVKKYFPSQRLVYSFKNHTHTQEDFKNIRGHYDEIVLGRQNIRNYDLFDFIKSNLNSRVVLLINNGCSHTCGGCTTLENCHSSYYRSRFNSSSEYLYALQSIMPFEFHEGLFDISKVDLLKISSRNASLQYLEDCMNSYIHCIEDDYILQSNNNYMLWGRLAWHAEYYNDFSLERIRELKLGIYKKARVSLSKQPINICLDFRDGYIFDKHSDKFVKPNLSMWIPKVARSIPYVVNECIIGVSNCRQLFNSISLTKLLELVIILRESFEKIHLEIPVLSQEDYDKLDEILTLLSDTHKMDCLIINDWDTLEYIRIHYDCPIAIGEQLSFSNINSPANNYQCDNDEHFGKKLVSSFLRGKITKIGNIAFVVLDMFPNGLCISKNEENKLYVNLTHCNIAYDICTNFGSHFCKLSCLNNKDRKCSHIITSAPWKIHCNAIQENINKFDLIAKTVFENRATFIIKCEE